MKRMTLLVWGCVAMASYSLDAICTEQSEGANGTARQVGEDFKQFGKKFGATVKKTGKEVGTATVKTTKSIKKKVKSDLQKDKPKPAPRKPQADGDAASN